MEVKKLTPENSFSIWSRWNPRVETPEELGRWTLRCLDEITPLNPAFHDWQFLDLSADISELADGNIEDYLCPLEKARPRIKDLVTEWGNVTDDHGRPNPDEYGICVVNYHVPDSQHVSLKVNGGAPVSWTGATREASFETPMYHEVDTSIVSYPVFKSVLMTIASCFDVDFAIADSLDLRRLCGEARRPVFDLSWMVYLSAPLAARIVVPSGIVVEHTPDGGVLMIAAEETFDVANPDHVAHARIMTAALEPLIKEEQERLDKLYPWWARKREIK